MATPKRARPNQRKIQRDQQGRQGTSRRRPVGAADPGAAVEQGAGAGQRLPDHGAGPAARPHRRLAEGRRPRADADGRLPSAREDHALRPRADPRACGPRPRRRRARRVRVVRQRRRASRAPTSCSAGASTPVFTRFSTVVGSRGSADTVRDVRGFAVKFYTDEGIFDLVGNNIPVFFIRDGIKFPDLIHAAKPEPDREIPQAQTAHTTFWDFVSMIPESPHMLMWAMSDRAIPRSYRMMEGFGVHTFRLVNAAGETSPRQVPLEAGARRARARVGRGADPQRRRSRLPPARPVQRDRRRRVPRVGARRAGDARQRGSVLRGHRSARRDEDRARGAGAGAADRADDAQPQSRPTSSPRSSRSRSTSVTSCGASRSSTTR